ncbi:hypothetical protein ACHQM5_011192 [Ranunculus cassubicifolius]
MADENASGSGSAESSESTTIGINVKNLESQVYSFQVNRNMLVSALKEKVASASGVAVEQQRLIFRGKVLKDDQRLSEYHVEDGNTLHLVIRPPVQSDTSTGTSSGETNRNINNNQGNDAGSGVPRGRVGVSRSVLLGSFNVGDQGGEGNGPDLSRIIGAVLNSFGIGNQNPTGGSNNVSSNVPSNASSQTPQGVETSRNHGDNGGRSQSGTQMPHRQTLNNLPFQSLQSLPFPLTGPAAVIPSAQMPIPDALHTLSEFINRMERVLSATGYWPSPSSSTVGDPPREDLSSPLSTNEGDPLRESLPTNAHGLPTPEALSIILRRAQHLISGHAVAALSHIAGRLEEEGGATDPTVRNQIQTEAVQVGLATQHLGSLLLELGRTILTLRMGQSPAESLVYAGPSVYISPSGPNPIMVQPFPLQTSSIFGGPASSQPTMASVGSGDALRNVNIHIHAIGSRGVNGERNNNPIGPPSGPTRVVPPRNSDPPAVPSEALNDAFSIYGRAPSSNQTHSNPNTVQPNVGDSAPHSLPDSVSLPAIVAEVNAQIRNLIDMRGERQVQSGQSEDSRPPGFSNEPSLHDIVRNHQEGNVGVNGAEEGDSLINGGPETTEQQKPKSDQHINDQRINEGVTGSSNKSNEGSATHSTGKSKDNSDEASRSKDVPLGLGLGGLQPKKRTKQVKNASGPSHTNENQQLIGQHVLQSLVSHGPNPNTRDANQTQDRTEAHGVQTRGARDPSNGQIDAASMMSQVLNNPALNGLLNGVSQQAGIGSADGLRNMLTQFTQTPSMRNTLNQIVQQIDGQDVLGNLPGLAQGGGGSGGFDLSRMVQQMMPIVSQALSGSGSSSASAREPSYRQEPREQPRRQIDIEQIVESIECNDPPQEIFGSVLELVSTLTDDRDIQDTVSELSTSVELANEFMDMLYRSMRHQV